MSQFKIKSQYLIKLGNEYLSAEYLPVFSIFRHVPPICGGAGNQGSTLRRRGYQTVWRAPGLLDLVFGRRRR